jgi:hypothetical protein
MSIDFDFGHFHTLLLEAARKAFTETRQQHADEQFYAFALMISPWVFFVLPTSNTEEGLLRAAAATASSYSGNDKAMVVRQNAKEMRWLCSDWAYHGEHEAYFSEINQQLEDMPEHLADVSAEVSDACFQEYLRICAAVLQTLDAEGVFGNDRKERGIILHLLMSDQSMAEMLSYAALINPPELCQQFEQEVKEGWNM